METDSPFAFGEEIDALWAFDNNYVEFVDMSDEIGDTYPKLEITCKSDGTLELLNNRMSEPMRIKNCTNGEVLYIDCENQVIESSESTHKILNDFNYNFFRIGNTLESRKNIISASMPVLVRMTYRPIIKDAL